MTTNEAGLSNLSFIKDGFNIELNNNISGQQEKINLENSSTGIKFGLQTKENIQKNKLDIFDDDDGSYTSPVVEQKSKLPNMNEMLKKIKIMNRKEKLEEYDKRSKVKLQLKEDKISSNKDKPDYFGDKLSKERHKHSHKSATKEKRTRSTDDKYRRSKRKSEDSREHSKEKKRDPTKSVENSKDIISNSKDSNGEKRRYSEKKIKYNEKLSGPDNFHRRDNKHYDNSPKRKKERHSDPRYQRSKYSSSSSHGDGRKRFSDSFSIDRKSHINDRDFIRPRTPDKLEKPEKLLHSDKQCHRNRHQATTHNHGHSDSTIIHKSPKRKTNSFSTRLGQYKRKPMSIERCRNNGFYHKIAKRNVMKHLKEEQNKKNLDNIQKSSDIVEEKWPHSEEIDRSPCNDNYISTCPVDLSSDTKVERTQEEEIEKVAINIAPTIDPIVSRAICHSNSSDSSKSFSKIKDHKVMRKIIDSHPSPSSSPLSSSYEANEADQFIVAPYRSSPTPKFENQFKNVGKFLDINGGQNESDSSDNDGDSDRGSDRDSNKGSEGVSDEDSDVDASCSSSDRTASMRYSPTDIDESQGIITQMDEPIVESVGRGYPMVCEVYSDEELGDIDVGMLTSISGKQRRVLGHKFASITSKTFFQRFQQLIYGALKRNWPGVSFDSESSKFDFNMGYLPDSLVLSIEKLVAHHTNKTQQIY